MTSEALRMSCPAKAFCVQSFCIWWAWRVELLLRTKEQWRGQNLTMNGRLHTYLHAYQVITLYIPASYSSSYSSRSSPKYLLLTLYERKPHRLLLCRRYPTLCTCICTRPTPWQLMQPKVPIPLDPAFNPPNVAARGARMDE